MLMIFMVMQPIDTHMPVCGVLFDEDNLIT